MAWAVAGLAALTLGFASPAFAAKTGAPAAAAANASTEPGALISFSPLKLPFDYRAKAWRILYMTRDHGMNPILSSGVVVLPDKAAQAAGERKFVAWAHPTTGIAENCAPSLRGSPLKWIGGLNDLVASGVVVAATDYPGLGTEGPLGYLVGKGQAFAVIDSVRAAQQIPGVGTGTKYALWGYSQGAHGVLFGAELAGSYAPELSLKGVAAIAPPTDLATLMRDILNSVAGRVIGAYTLYSWHEKYGAPLETLVDAHAQALVAEVSQTCVDDLEDKLHILSEQKGLTQDFMKQDPGSVEPWAGLLSQNSLLTYTSKVPTLILQGTADEIVKPDVTNKFVSAACRSGAQIEFQTLQGKGHGGAMKAGEGIAASWLADRLAGQPMRGNCR